MIRSVTTGFGRSDVVEKGAGRHFLKLARQLRRAIVLNSRAAGKCPPLYDLAIGFDGAQYCTRRENGEIIDTFMLALPLGRWTWNARSFKQYEDDLDATPASWTRNFHRPGTGRPARPM